MLLNALTDLRAYNIQTIILQNALYERSNQLKSLPFPVDNIPLVKPFYFFDVVLYRVQTVASAADMKILDTEMSTVTSLLDKMLTSIHSTATEVIKHIDKKEKS